MSMSSTDPSNKTFLITALGCIERQASIRSGKPSALGGPKEAKKDHGDIKLVYSRQNAASLLKQSKRMYERAALVHRRLGAHESFNSCSLIDNIDPSESAPKFKSNMAAHSMNLTHHCEKRYAVPKGRLF